MTHQSDEKAITHFVGDDCPGGHLDDMQAVDELLADAEMAPPTLGGEPREYRHRRHHWYRDDILVIGEGIVAREVCVCGRVKDPIASRRGKNARSRGNALERWVNGLLGISNRGKYGGPEDGGGEADWISVQTKSGTYFPRTIDRWLRQVPVRAGQMRGVVLVETPGAGPKRRALLVVDLYEAADEWGQAQQEVK